MNKKTGLHKILARISSYFIGDFVLDDALQKSFMDLGKFIGAERIYLYRIHHKAKIAHVTHKWLNPDSDIPGIITSFTLDDFQWLIGQLKRKELVLVENLDDLPDKAANERNTLHKQKVRSFIVFPLKIKEKLEGLIGLDCIENELQISGEQIEILKIALDIIGFSVERKLSESTLHKTEKLYQSIFENAGAATLTIRSDTGISMVNSEFERLTGYSRKGVEGKVRLTDILGEDDRSKFRRYNHLLLSNPGALPENYEFKFITRKGETRTAQMTGSAPLDTKTCVISFIDITAFKETEEQLIRARDKAEESDKLKSAFLANVSHEIRTPLNAITGFSSLLSNPNLHLDKKGKYIKQIMDGSNELVGLIDNVLDISRIESRTLHPSISEFLLDAKLEEILDFYNDYKLQHAKEDIAIRLKLPTDIRKLVIKTDRRRLLQILSNLIENAIKFTSSGSVEFGYSLLDEVPNGSGQKKILFFVKDSGIGIAKKDREKVFERFVKIVDKDQKLFRGAGLGLSLARDLVELLGGEIWVESELGKGSTFFFTLPYESPVDTGKGTKSEDSVTRTDWSKRTILVAEDTESNYKYIEEILSETGINFIRATNGLEAIEIFRSNKNKIDLVLMDILMPEYDGFEAAREILKSRKDIPIIAQTAFTFEGELSDGLYAGCFNDYILKPFQIKEIQDMLNKYL